MDPLVTLSETIPRICIPDDTELELEIRYGIDERSPGGLRKNKFNPLQAVEFLKSIINFYLKKKVTCSIEQSINFISKDNNIKRLLFINGKQDKNLVTYYNKNPLINPVNVIDNPPYKITLSYEKKISEFSINDCIRARIKLRFTIILNKKWRIDITLIKGIDNLTNILDIKTKKAKMLYTLSVRDFVEKAPWDFADHFEFEYEYIGKHTDFKYDDFMEIIQSDNAPSQYVLSNLTNDSTNNLTNSEYQQIIYKIAQWIKPKQANRFRRSAGIKQLSNQVIEMDKNMFISQLYPHITDYFITDKVDGKRALIIIDNSGSWAITNTLIELSISLPDTYIFDTELYEDHYYIFDVLVYKNNSLVDTPFSNRLKLFDDVIKNINLPIKKKLFVRLNNNFQQMISQFKKRKHSYNVDGIVFTPANEYYNNMKVYKYKPINKLSIDFLIKKCPKQLLGISPYIEKDNTLYLLFCGISKHVFNKLNLELIRKYEMIFPNINNKYQLPQYFPFQFEPSDCKFAYLYWDKSPSLDNQIGEFIIGNINTKSSSRYKWKMLRLRPDRSVEVARGNYFGNNYRVAEMTWLNYQNPLIIETMDLSSVYFKEHDSEFHKVSRNFNSYVKNTIFQQFNNTKYVLDIASGKGQDLFRYAKFNMQNVLFTDKDKTALMELNFRKHEFSKNRNNTSMYVMTQPLDLNRPYLDNIEALSLSNINIPTNGFNLIMCNFAFHYFLNSEKSINNICKFINEYLKPGGRFVFTSFDGEQIIKLLKSTANWTTSDCKYSIIKKYKQNIIQPYGQKIDVKLPFSKDAYYIEYLVNIDYIEQIFEKLNIELESNQSFSEYFDKYENKSQLNNDDKQYLSLYHYYCFYKPVKTHQRND